MEQRKTGGSSDTSSNNRGGKAYKKKTWQQLHITLVNVTREYMHSMYVCTYGGKMTYGKI